MKNIYETNRWVNSNQPTRLKITSAIVKAFQYARIWAMETLILIIEVILSILLIGGVLLQRSDASLGGALGGGGGDESTTQFTRRGAEKKLFNATIGVAVLLVFFLVLSFTI